MPQPTVQPTEQLTNAQRYYADAMMDVLVYTVVLNLVVEYVDSVVIYSFTVSLLTAIVMKVMIDGINALVDRAKVYFGAKDSTLEKVLLALSSWAIMFGSKVVILLVVQIIFEEDVDLGGFLNVLLIVLAMMIARRIASLIFRRLGDGGRLAGQSLAQQSADDPI